MVFFPEPLRPSEGRDEDRLRVNPIEADRQYRESRFLEEPKTEDKTIPPYTCLLLFFKELTTYVDERYVKIEQPLDSPELAHLLLKLKSLLDKLKEGDFSQDAHYCQMLSELWHELIEDIDMQTHFSPSHTQNIAPIKVLIQEMNTFPPQAEHRLGFYLSHYAGESWLPVPFSEILKQLHQGYRTYREKSTLASWTDKINDVIPE